MSSFTIPTGEQRGIEFRDDDGERVQLTVGHVPGRKSWVLIKTRGSVTASLAYFNTDEAAFETARLLTRLGAI